MVARRGKAVPITAPGVAMHLAVAAIAVLLSYPYNEVLRASVPLALAGS